MLLPAQVKAQGEKADARLKELSEKEKASAAAVANLEDQGKDKPVVTETVESLTTKLAEAEHKLSVLQGKYNSEVQALKDDVNLLNTLKHQARQANDQILQLNGQLGEAQVLIGQLQKQITEKQPVKDDTKPALSEEDREYLRGEGFEDKTIEIFAKVLSKGTSDSGVQGELEKIKQELAQEKAKDFERAKARFWSELEEKVPDWNPINVSDEFNDWLDVQLPYSTETRRSKLKGAEASWDYATVIQIFNDFKSANPKKGKKSEHQIDPAKQIDPASSVVHEEPLDKKKVQGKIYTRQEVKDFYKDQSLGKYKGKEDEAKRIDADILLANQEGRIQG
jgi:predicted  nucleic acid-binding Zn-ribbon protein